MSNANSSWEPEQRTIWDAEPSWRGEPVPEIGESSSPTRSPILGDTVELSITDEVSQKQPRKHVGFATEPGYDLAEYRA